MGVRYSPGIVTDNLKLLIDPKDDVCNGGKSVLTDLSGNSISGSLYSGNGLNFDDTSGKLVSIPDSSKFNFGAGPFAFSIWAKVDTLSGLLGLAAQWGSVEAWQFYINADGTLTFTCMSTGDAAVDQNFDSSPVVAGVWSHIVILRDGNTFYSYVNNVSAGTTSYSDTLADSSRPVLIGALEGGSDDKIHPFDGDISDFKIFNTALSATDVSELYNKPNTVLPGSVSGSQLVGWWPLTERNGTIAHDGSGNGNHGTLTNGPTWVSSSADIPQLGSKGFSKKMVFDGSNDYVSIANSSNWDILTDGAAATIAAWVKFNTHAGEDYIIVQRESDVKYWGLRHSDGSGGFHFSVYNTSSTIIDSGYQGEVEDNDWHHIAMTKDASDNYILYKDGSVIGSFSDSSDVNFDGPLLIGVLNAGADHFDGLIDEVAIWNINLSTGSLQDISNKTSYGLPNPKDARNVSGSNLVAYYRNNGKGEETWNDLSGNTATKVTPTGSPTEIYFPESHIKGRDSQGMFLTNPNEGWYDVENNNTYDTAGAYINLGSDAIVAAGPLTVCLWVYWPIRSGGPLVTFKTGGNGFILHGESDGKIFMGFHGEHKMNTAGDPATISTWNHIAAVYDGNDDDLVGSYKIYVNGISYSLSRTGSTLNGTVTVNMIGNDTGTTSWNVNPFEKGRITAVSVYEKALSSAEVLQNYNAQLGRFESISEDYWQ